MVGAQEEDLENNLIVIIAKAPQVGKVKTRLCPPLNYTQAALLYRGFLLDTVELALKVPGSRVKIICPSGQDADQLQDFLPEAVGYFVQDQPGLTAALSEGFKKGLAEGFSKVLCISSDNPTLPVRYLEEAFQGLETSQVVLGPTDDGGYYLIGARQLYPVLLDDMVWSTATVMAETQERAVRAGLTVRVLPWWYDLDTGMELEQFRNELKGLPMSEAFYSRQAMSTAFAESLPLNRSREEGLPTAEPGADPVTLVGPGLEQPNRNINL